MSLGLGVLGCGSVFSAPYRAMIERLRATGASRSARSSTSTAETPWSSRALGVDPSSTSPRASVARRRRRRRPRADEHERARPAREGGARGRQARARREADGDVARGGGGAGRGRARPGRHARLRAAHRAPPTYREMHKRIRGGRGRRGSCPPEPVTAGPARGGAVVLPAGRRGAVRPRRLQPDEPVRILRARRSG